MRMRCGPQAGKVEREAKALLDEQAVDTNGGRCICLPTIPAQFSMTSFSLAVARSVARFSNFLVSS